MRSNNELLSQTDGHSKARQCVLIAVNAFRNDEPVNLLENINAISATEQDVIAAINITANSLDIDLAEQNIGYNLNDSLAKLAQVLERVVELGLDAAQTVIDVDIGYNSHGVAIYKESTSSSVRVSYADDMERMAQERGGVLHLRALFRGNQWRSLRSLLDDNKLPYNKQSVKVTIWLISSAYIANSELPKEEALEMMSANYLYSAVVKHETFNSISEFITYHKEVKKLSPEQIEVKLDKYRTSIKVNSVASKKPSKMFYFSPAAQADFVREYIRVNSEKLEYQTLSELLDSWGIKIHQSSKVAEINLVVGMLAGLQEREMHRLEKQFHMPADLAREYVKTNYLSVEGQKNNPTVVKWFTPKVVRVAKIYAKAQEEVEANMKALFPDVTPKELEKQRKTHPRTNQQFKVDIAR